MTDHLPCTAARWFTIPALLLLPLTALCLRLFGFKKMYRFTGRVAGLASGWTHAPLRPMVKAQQIAQSVTNANRRLSFFQASCLAESMLLWGLLKSCGIDARFCMGVRTITGPLDAHAWVRYGDAVLNDLPAVNRIYAELDLDYRTPGAGIK